MNRQMLNETLNLVQVRFLFNFFIWGGDNLVSEKPYRSSYYYCLFNLSKNGLKKLSNILCSNQFLKAKSEVMFWNLIKYSKYLWKCNLMCLRDRDYAMFQPSYRTICAALLCWKHWCFSCWRLYKQMNILMWNLSTVKEIIQNTVQEIIQCSKKKTTNSVYEFEHRY